MGGAISSTVARALGAGRRDEEAQPLICDAGGLINSRNGGLMLLSLRYFCKERSRTLHVDPPD
jgi:hypothetical protein